MEQLEIRPWQLLTNFNLDLVILSSPQVTDKDAIATRFRLGESIGFVAGKFSNMLSKVVSDICAEAALVGRLPWPVQTEILAAWIRAVVVGTSIPSIHDVIRGWVVLRDDEARVEVCFAKSILVILTLRIQSESHRVIVGIQLPVIQQPLEW